MADLRKGAADVATLYVGSKPVTKVYKGTSLIYTRP